MILSAPFIVRPIATTLIWLAVVLTGLLSYRLLPVAPLPQVEIPTISVTARLPGASAETMAASVATPLERSLGNIAGVIEMTSSSTQGSTRITLQFDLNRDIDGAARDVQAAINAARTLLPSSLRSRPTYRRSNPAAAPIMTIALTSDVLNTGKLYDLASTILAQKLAQVSGIGEVQIGGSSLPAVRVDLIPGALISRGIALDDVRKALIAANSNYPKGVLEDGYKRWQIMGSSSLNRAQDYQSLIVAWRNGAPVRLSDVAQVEDSVEDSFQMGFFNKRPAVILILQRQADANILDTVQAVRAQLPRLTALLPGDVTLTVAQDRTPSIRATLRDAESTLLLSLILVIVVVMLFLRHGRAALISSLAVFISLIGTFCIIFLCGYTLNMISLMALIVATGFVVDDAIVVLENIMRYIEKGYSPKRAAFRGAREVGFTVLSMSLSLIAVFIPVLLMGGVVGRLFREFAITLSASIVVSLFISLTLTPMLCAYLLGQPSQRLGIEEMKAAMTRNTHHKISRLLYQGRLFFTRFSLLTQQIFDKTLQFYARTLKWVLNHQKWIMLLLLATMGLNVYLYQIVPKGFFPQQDIGQLRAFFMTDQGTSFQAMQPQLIFFREQILADSAVESVTSFAGGRGGSNSSFMLIQLKPLSQRDASATEIVNRLRKRLRNIAGARIFIRAQQDIRIGGRQSSGSYEYTLKANDLATLHTWLPRVQQVLSTLPELTDVDTDAEDKGTQINVVIDRQAATRLGVDMTTLDASLNNSFSQRQVAVMFEELNQYHVVMGVAAPYAQDIDSLRTMEVINHSGQRVPLLSFAHLETGKAPLSVSHQGLMVAETVSFSLAPGVSLSQASKAIEAAIASIHLPSEQVQASFQGTAAAFQKILSQQPWLILAALGCMYIILGILYESTIHPLTILSTLPSAGIGALLALFLVGNELTLIALIGVFLLIGIVKKNAIMMVDFALVTQRRHHLKPREAIFQACLTRFRPIMMTTLAALFGALPLALAVGTGAEMRRPLGITIVGGLIFSQLLTLYTTPVVYLYLDRLRSWALVRFSKRR